MSLVKPLKNLKHAITFSRKTKTGARRKLNKKTRSYSFRSKFEEEFWNFNKGKIPLQYEPFVITYTVSKQGKYIPDFLYERHKGSNEYLVYETKGWWLSKDRMRLKDILASNPGLQIVMVFMRDNFLTKAKHRRYSDWCEENGIPYCVGVNVLENIVWPRIKKKEG